jgi:hypothetical protein
MRCNTGPGLLRRWLAANRKPPVFKLALFSNKRYGPSRRV